MSDPQAKDGGAGEAAAPVQRDGANSDGNEDPEQESPAVEFEPIVSLPLVEVKTLEEDESELLKLRAKLYRYETSEDPAEWKERGLGDVKFLKNPKTHAVRILMRREKTLKICANHYVTPTMSLNRHANNDKAFVWSTVCDYSDGEARPETFCIRFGSVDSALAFKKSFEEAKEAAASIKHLYDGVRSMQLQEQESCSSGSDDESEDAGEEEVEEAPGAREREEGVDEQEGKEARVEGKGAEVKEREAKESKENEAPEANQA